LTFTHLVNFHLFQCELSASCQSSPQVVHQQTLLSIAQRLARRARAGQLESALRLQNQFVVLEPSKQTLASDSAILSGFKGRQAIQFDLNFVDRTLFGC
jgi:hypothetical protein